MFLRKLKHIPIIFYKNVFQNVEKNLFCICQHYCQSFTFPVITKISVISNVSVAEEISMKDCQTYPQAVANANIKSYTKKLKLRRKIIVSNSFDQIFARS